MKISAISIENFRSFESAHIEIGNYTSLLGPNGSGKSNILQAANLFFGDSDSTQSAQITEQDFYMRNTDQPIEITLTFMELSPEAKEDFKDYVRQDQLVVSAIANFNKSTGRAEIKQFGQRLGMQEFAGFFKALGDGVRVPDLRDIYTKIKENYSELPAASTKDAMVSALREYEAARPEACSLMLSEDQFYGISKARNLLEKYLQWIYVPAVKDISTEQLEGRNTALGKLLARTVRAKISFSDDINVLLGQAREGYKDLLAHSQNSLNEVSESLRARLAEWYTPDVLLRLEWSRDPDKSIKIEEPFAEIVAGEGAFEGKLSQFGHGLQRAYLLALLQELSGSDDSNGPRMILACEEPELYQHPPQARHLFNVLQKLSQLNSQIIVTTHSPYFVSGQKFEDIRLIRKEQSCSGVGCIKAEDLTEFIASTCGDRPDDPTGLLAKIHQALQPTLSEMFFTPRLILVEGLEDVAHITTYLNLLGCWDKFRELGCHIVPANGKSAMIKPLAIARRLSIPTFIIVDGDKDKCTRDDRTIMHKKENIAILRLCGCEEPEPFPEEPLWGRDFVMWATDIQQTVKKDMGNAKYDEYSQKADAAFGHIGNMEKNTLHIAALLNMAWEDNVKSSSLIALSEKLIAFGKEART